MNIIWIICIRMAKLTLLSDDNIVEGVAGLVTFIVTYFILRTVIHASPWIRGGMAWFITWFMRRSSVYAYDYLKKTHGVHIPSLSVTV